MNYYNNLNSANSRRKKRVEFLLEQRHIDFLKNIKSIEDKSMSEQIRDLIKREAKW